MSKTYLLKTCAYLVQYEGNDCNWSLSDRTISHEQIALRMEVSSKKVCIYAGPADNIETFPFKSKVWIVKAKANNTELLFEAFYTKSCTTRLVLVEFMDMPDETAEWLCSQCVYFLSKHIVVQLVTTDLSRLLLGRHEIAAEKLKEEKEKKFEELVDRSVNELKLDPDFPENILKAYDNKYELVEKTVEEFLLDPQFPDYVQKVYDNLPKLANAEE